MLAPGQLRYGWLVACSIAAAGLVAAMDAAEPTPFGAGVTLEEVTPLGRVIESPAAYEGRTIRTEGTVTAVCSHMGCWMALAAAGAPGRTLMVKVDDGVIVFPVSAKGRRAAAQGVLQRVGADREAQSAAAEHASQTGQQTSPAQSWQLKATGAVVY